MVTTMVTIWYPIWKHLPQILREKYHQQIKNSIYHQNVFPDKPVNACSKEEVQQKLHC